MSLREAAQQALLVLESGLLVSHSSQVVTDLRAALAEPDYWQEEARRYAGNADYWRKRYETLAEPPECGADQEIEAAAKKAGGRWDGNQWVFEDPSQRRVLWATLERRAALAEPQVWVCPEAADTHRYDKPGHCEDCGKTLIQMADPEPFQPDWDRVEALQKSLREHMAEIQRLRAALAEPIVALYAAPPQREPTEPGWYVVLPPDFDTPTVRAFGRDRQWWIPLGKGNGEEGWMTGRPYKNWVGPIADIDAEQPFRAASAPKEQA